MRITQVLCKWHPEFRGYIPKYPGNVFTGKHRFTPPVTGMAKYFVMRQILYEEEAIKYLKSPYITEKQEGAYLQSIGRTQHEHYDEFMFKKIVKPERQLYAADLIKRLDVDRTFDPNDNNSSGTISGRFTGVYK